MADDPGDAEVEDERILELSTVAAIYPELLIDTALDQAAATVDISVEPTEPLLIRFPTADGAQPKGVPTPPNSAGEGVHQVKENKPGDPILNDIHQLSYLPPLTLSIVLPEEYPFKEPPLFHLESQYAWIPETTLGQLEGAGCTLWEELGRDQMIFSYIDYLRDAAERGFDLADNQGQVLEISADLQIALLDFDLKARRAKFEQQTFECEPKRGAVCHRLLLCAHVFCVACLQDFYNTSIAEGDVGNIKCIAPDCGSNLAHPTRELDADKTLDPSELLQIPLEQEIVQRYIKLKRKKRLESDKSTIYCPRQWCQGPAKCPNKKTPSATDEQIEPQEYDHNTNQDKLPPPAERLAICEDCNFAFCKVCKASWHGEFFVCFPRSEFELTAEEKLSEDYMKLHTQACPTCDARAQKTHGCNHMICFKCDTHFCYLCGAYLDKSNPYQHYNTVKSGCYMRLWELEGGDDGEFGQGFAGGRNGFYSSDDDDDD
ncbi:hypothetical protein ACLMJK_001612 [Lecanora helva]